MRTVATIALSLVAILASLCFVVSGTCSITGDFSGTTHRGAYLLWAIFYLVIVVAAMTAIRKIKRQSPGK